MTSIVPFMPGWMTQKYVYVPGAVDGAIDTANVAPDGFGMTPEFTTDVPSKLHGGAVGPVLQVELVGKKDGGARIVSLSPVSDSCTSVGRAWRSFASVEPAGTNVTECSPSGDPSAHWKRTRPPWGTRTPLSGK